RERIRAHIEVEASVDLFDPRDERGRTLRPIDARGDEGSDRTHFSGREFAVLSADLQDSFVVPAPLLLTRIAQGRLDPEADVDVLAAGEVLESMDCILAVV